MEDVLTTHLGPSWELGRLGRDARTVRKFLTTEAQKPEGGTPGSKDWLGSTLLDAHMVGKGTHRTLRTAALVIENFLPGRDLGQAAPCPGTLGEHPGRVNPSCFTAFLWMRCSATRVHNTVGIVSVSNDVNDGGQTVDNVTESLPTHTHTHWATNVFSTASACQL